MWFLRSFTFQVVGQVLLNYFAVTVPFLYLSYPLMKWRGLSPLRELPNFYWVLTEMAVFALTLEISFYYSHRYLAKDKWVLVATLWTCSLLIGYVTGKLGQTVYRNPPCCLLTHQPFEQTRQSMVGGVTFLLTLSICYYQALTIPFLCSSVPGWLEHHGQWAEYYFNLLIIYYIFHSNFWSLDRLQTVKIISICTIKYEEQYFI